MDKFESVIVNGKHVPRVRFGEEKGILVADDKCAACRALPGELHSSLCDLEECPACGGQFISCGCWAEPSALDLDFDQIADFIPELREIESKVRELRVCLTFEEISIRFADRVNELLQGHQNEILHCNHTLHLVCDRFLEIYRDQDEDEAA